MRKLLTFSALFMTLMLGSCLKKIETTPASPVAPGVAILNYTRMTTMASIDPVNVAIRLNLLLDASVAAAEAAEDGDLQFADYANLDGLKVVTEGKPDVEIKKYLFDRATVTTDAQKKIWTIIYPGGIVNRDNTRLGTVIINTNGLRLSENGVWSITVSNDLKLMSYSDMYSNNYDLQQIFDFVTVSSSDNGQSFDFEVSYKGYIGRNTEYPVDWNSEGTFSFGQYNTFAKLLEQDAQYSLAVSGSGKAYYFYSQCSFDVDSATPLVFSPNCSWKKLSAGRVSASFQNYYTIPELFPAPDVDCEYIVTNGNCGAMKLKVDYNNATETLDLY